MGKKKRIEAAVHQYFDNGKFEVFILWKNIFECRILDLHFFSLCKFKASVYSTLASLFVLGDLDVIIDVSQFYIPSVYLSIFLFVNFLLLFSILVKVN